MSPTDLLQAALNGFDFVIDATQVDPEFILFDFLIPQVNSYLGFESEVLLLVC